MKKVSTQIMMEMEKLCDLVQLRTFFATREQFSRFLYVLPTQNPQKKCLFFYNSFNFSNQPFFMYYCFFMASPSENVQAVKYNKKRGKIELVRQASEDSSVSYLPLFPVKKFNSNSVTLKNSEDFPYTRDLDFSYLKYIQGKDFREIIRIAINLENIVLVIKYTSTYMYITGFPFSLFPLKLEEVFRIPVIWANGPDPRKKKSSPLFVDLEGKKVDFLEQQKSGRTTAPLISVKSFPFKLPEI